MKQLPRTVHFDRAKPPRPHQINRRQFLGYSAGALAAGSVAGCGGGSAGSSAAAATAPGSTAQQAAPANAEEALAVLGKSVLRLPGSLPYPNLAAGTDTMPQIQHIVVVMLENHSFDNLLGMLGRGDGYSLGANGLPTASNPYGDGRVQMAFEMPTTCQLSAMPSQEWKASHQQYASGALNGFVQSSSGPVAMGYWTGSSLPFTYALAAQFPIGDRFFCSVLGQTDPNRRYLIAATSAGMTDDIGGSIGNLIPDLELPLPGNGTIFDRLSAHGISWADYCANFPLGATAELYPIDDLQMLASKKTISQFFADTAAGTLPGFSIVDMDYSTQSQENPQNIAVGEQFLAQVVNAIGASPAWEKTLLIINYDEHGGYYDHVPPPAALAPDLIPPIVQPGEDTYEGFSRYGFRVPSIVVSPYAKTSYVSHLVYDHTSILATVERKWNLPALTWRDANANDLTDFLDLEAMTAGTPTFPTLPSLPASGDTAATLACSSSGPGLIPPPQSILGW
jgi:phospholipase C